MADEEHLRILRQGVEVWNRWRKEARGASRPDLSKADLHGLDLERANFDNANLGGSSLALASLRKATLHDAKLSEADLSNADLRDANLGGADLSSAHLFGANLSGAKLHAANLSGAKIDDRSQLDDKWRLVWEIVSRPAWHRDLSGADLSSAYLENAELFGATLLKTDLSGSGLQYARLRQADLRQANLEGADLQFADLVSADLRGACLDFAHLGDVNLGEAKLSGADLSNATLYYTIFGGVDLSLVKGLSETRHSGPSYIDFRTLHLSKGRIPKAFLRGAGVPDSFITYVTSLTGEAIQYHSCFISYSSKDDDFAGRLHADLQDNAVRCWFAPEDMKIGDEIRPRIDQSIRLHDKLLVVLSEHSIDSDWVEDEVETAIEEERKRKEKVLFPIRLDEAVMDTDEAWATKIRRTRHIGDFSHWKDHDSYQGAFGRLLSDLKAEEG